MATSFISMGATVLQRSLKDIIPPRVFIVTEHGEFTCYPPGYNFDYGMLGHLGGNPCNEIKLVDVSLVGGKCVH